MLYLNQLNYPDIPYEHNVAAGGPPEGKGNVAAAGCGPCCLCMMVENLTTEHLDLMDCLKMSADLKANMERGTDLKILGKAVAEKFGLGYSTNSPGNYPGENHSCRGTIIWRRTISSLPSPLSPK